jgi:tetratricopeptide (TPR) repeat protein
MSKSKQSNKRPDYIDPKKKLIFSLFFVLIPLIFLLLVEMTLRSVNYGQNYSLFVDFDLFGKKYSKVNPEYGKKYFYDLPFMSPNNDIFLKEKPKNGYRIFVIGSSTTAGFPYTSGIMFSRILQERLQDSYPDKQVEVVNTAMTAINSFAFQDKIDEILNAQPDAILIYGGHNEFYGGLGIASKEALGKLRWIKILHLNLLEFKTYQLMRELIFGTQRLFTGKNSTDAQKTGTMMQKIATNKDVEYNSPIYKLAHEHFKKNMQTILEKAHKKGVSVFFSELISNIKDLPPLGSSISKSYPPAMKVYQEGLAFEKAGDYEKAKINFYQAKDLDCIRFRASEDMNSIINTLSKEYGAYPIPMKRIFEENSPHGLIGNNLITEHLHPNIDGYFLMADAFYSSIVDSKVIGKIDSQFYKPSIYYRKNWGFTPVDSLTAELSIQKIKAGWPFQPETTENNYIKNYKPKGIVDSIAYQSVRYTDITPEYAHKFLAKYYLAHHAPDKAEKEYLAILKIEPYKIENFIDAGNLLFQEGKYDKALDIFLQALKINRDIYILSKIGEIYSKTGNFAKAIPYYEEVVKLDSEFQKQLILKLLYQAYIESGNSEKAKEIYHANKELLTQDTPESQKKEVLLRTPTDVRDLIKEAIKCLKSGNIDKGFALLNQANNIHETPVANRFLGDILLQRKDPKSLECLKKVYSDYSTDPEYLNTLCYASIYFKDFEYAKKILPELKRLSPNNPNIPAFEKKISMQNN